MNDPGTTAQHVLSYLSGFGNEHETEAVPGALPAGQFSPQHPPFGLYPEQISATPFTAPRATNRRSWLYRIRPSVSQQSAASYALQSIQGDDAGWRSGPDTNALLRPDPQRWSTAPMSTRKQRFDESITTYTVTGSALERCGGAMHTYSATAAMDNVYLSNADGELVIVPVTGALRLRTECGLLEVASGEIAVLPQGMRFAADPVDSTSTGYVCENYGGAFELAERGPVGANGYANNRDFYYPVAAYEDIDAECTLITRFGGQTFISRLDHSPLDVVAWVGNHAPYKYDLARFNAMGTVTFDHPDPSIFTVLTSPTASPGYANLDFVIFPPRWSVAENTFRPPWYHRNVMSECMGLIRGQYDAKTEGFAPGGVSLHNAFTPHGPDAMAFARATEAKLQPEHTGEGLAFMLESRLPFATTQWAWQSALRQANYADCWQGLSRRFVAPAADVHNERR